MVVIKPFKAIRPAKDLAAKVAALPYDVINSEEARDLAAGNPYSYFHIDRAEIDLPQDISSYDPVVYQKAATNLADFLAKGWLKKDAKPYFYLYQLTMNGRPQTGIAFSASIDDYVNGKIKKHEFTRPEKEIDRIIQANGDHELFVVSDIFGGSVNNEWMKHINKVNNIHLVSGMNLAFLIELLVQLSNEETDSQAAILQAMTCANEGFAYCNQLQLNMTEDEF